MILPQAYWAALFIKLFGFSFFIVRLSTVVLSAGLIPILYYLGRESGLAPSFAAFGACLCILSPFALPQELSFMSDVPAFFLFSLCLYASVKAWHAKTARASITWALLAALAGAASALDRQVYWLAPLLFLPAVAWMRRRHRGILAGLAAAWLLVLGACVYAMRWVVAQPYFRVEPWFAAAQKTGPRGLILSATGLAVALALTAALMLAPVIAGFIPVVLRAASREAAALLLVLLAAVSAVTAIHRNLQAPWMSSIVTEYGVVPGGVIPFGLPPVVLGEAARIAITFFVFLCCLCLGVCIKRYRNHAAGDIGDLRTPVPLMALGLSFAAFWLPAILIRSAQHSTYDRYLITFFPLLAIPLLWFYQTKVQPRVSRTSWTALAIFSLYSVAVNHDAFTVARARLKSADKLEAIGVPRTAILAGYEYDGWTQIETAGFVNYKEIANPPGAYRPISCKHDEGWRWYISQFPALQPRYTVSLSHLSEFADGPVGPVSYTTWLPPGRHQVFTHILPEGYFGCR